jgi:sugar phosphate isomerase/epimerase
MKTNPSRRHFLGAAGAAGLGAIAPAISSATIVAEPWGVKLGIATYSLRSFDRTTAIAMLKKLQTKYVSIKDIHLKLEESAEELKQHRKEFDDAGLIVTSGGNVEMNKGTTIEYLRPKFEYAKNAGLPMMVCAPTHENLKNVEALVKEYNIRIAIHNHGPEDKHFPSPQSVLEAVRPLDKRCGLCMDIGHATRAGADIVKSAAEAGDRLFDMHVKDLGDGTKRESQVDIGDGILPFPALFKQLKKMGYQGCVNMEYEINAKDPMVGMQRSLSYMRGMLAGFAG